MKKIFSLLLLVIVFQVEIRGQIIPNQGFEDWHLIGGWHPCPDGWKVNFFWQHASYIFDDTIAYQGDYSIKIITTGIAESKFPFNHHPCKLYMYTKCSFETLDTVKVIVEVFFNGILVDSGLWENSNNLSNWSDVNIPISNNSSVCDSLRICLYGGKQIGTILNIDDLYTSFLDVDEVILGDQPLKIYPNPFHDNTTIDIKHFGRDPFRIDIFNSYGVCMRSIKNISSNKFILEKMDLLPGLYLILLQWSDQTRMTKKMIIY